MTIVDSLNVCMCTQDFLNKYPECVNMKDPTQDLTLLQIACICGVPKLVSTLIGYAFKPGLYARVNCMNACKQEESDSVYEFFLGAYSPSKVVLSAPTQSHNKSKAHTHVQTHKHNH